MNDKRKTVPPAKVLKEKLGEKRWEEFAKNVEIWISDALEGDFNLDLFNLKIEYKRDAQDAVNTAITSRVEEKLKEIICPRIPKWIGPDHLTLIGVFGVILCAIGLVLGFFDRNWLALVPFGLLVNWFGDSFDGSIARYRKRTRPRYGYYIDKIVDAVVIMIFALGLGLSGFVKIETALLFACAYYCLMLHVELVVHVENKAQNSFGLFGPTEIRIIGALATLVMYFLPVMYYDIYGHSLTQYDFATFGLALIMFLILLASMAKKGIQLHREDIRNW